MSQQLRVLLASDSPLMAAGLSRVLESDFEITHVAQDEGELLEAATSRHPEVVVLTLPDALATVRKLHEAVPVADVVLLNAPNDPEYAGAAFEAGASGYLVKEAEPAELVFAVRSVKKDGFYMSASVARLAFRWSAASSLTSHGEEVTECDALRVLIADDHFVVRQGLRALLAVGGIEVVGTAEDGRRAVELTRQLAPDVVLMDLMMPEMDGVEATRRILEHRPETRILVITGRRVDERALAAVKAGALGFLSKEVGRDEYLTAIRRVHRGEISLPPEISRQLMELDAAVLPPPPAALTRREREVLCLVARGLANQEIAERLFVSDVTVRTHLRNVMEKLALGNRVGLVLYALREGLVSLDEELSAS